MSGMCLAISCARSTQQIRHAPACRASRRVERKRAQGIVPESHLPQYARSLHLPIDYIDRAGGCLVCSWCSSVVARRRWSKRKQSRPGRRSNLLATGMARFSMQCDTIVSRYNSIYRDGLSNNKCPNVYSVIYKNKKNAPNSPIKPIDCRLGSWTRWKE